MTKSMMKQFSIVTEMLCVVAIRSMNSWTLYQTN